MSTTFNIAKHMLGEYWRAARNDSNNGIIVLLLKSSGLEADGTIADYDTLSAFLAASNDECDATNYVRKTIAGSGGSGVPAATVDDTNNRVILDLPDQTWSSLGGASNNTLGAVLLCYDSDTTTGTDANIVPLVKLDISSTTTDGNDFTIQFNTNGVLRVADAA